MNIVIHGPLDLVALKDGLDKSHHFTWIPAAVLRDALGRERASKHLERDVNELLAPYGLGSRAAGVNGQPVRKETLFMAYAKKSLLGRLIEDAGVAPVLLLHDVGADIAKLERLVSEHGLDSGTDDSAVDPSPQSGGPGMVSE